MANLRLKKTVLEVVDNQLRNDDPKITKITLNRLIGLGFTKEQAKEKIAAIVLEEIYDVMKNNEKFDENRFSKRMSDLK